MINQTENPTVFRVEEKTLDLISMGAFESDLESVLKLTRNAVYLDFAPVEEISSAILGILLHKKMSMKKRGIDIHLLNVSLPVKRILKILNLSTYLLAAQNTDTFSNFILREV